MTRSAGCGIQRMTIDTWLDVIERERERGDGHIGPTGVGNLPRPEANGGCDCPVCTKNAEIWRKKGVVW
ncbi:MAG: hypothetical protein JO061_12595 [Acidobacteriaceae bacterium]|nr:hypothetical protein [Acidobacteriaceae bacterium]